MTNKNIFLSLILLVTFYSLPAQVIEQALTRNIALENHPPSIDTRNNQPLQLPFIDDFSQNGVLPNLDLWINQQVFINNHFAVNPPSKGVATFDGLDRSGQPYPRGFGGSDTLTSQPIDLSNETAAFISFYIQPKGIGFNPRPGDSLVLEGKNSAGDWKHLHSFEGIPNSQAFAPAPEFERYQTALYDDFLHADFQFRLRNYSSNNGMEGLWHIDYVMVDNQPVNSFINDVAFVKAPNPILKTYSAYPLTHLKNDLSLISNRLQIEIQNNSDQTHMIDTSLFLVHDLTNDQSIYIDESLLEVPPLVLTNQRRVEPGLQSYTNTYSTFAVLDYIEAYSDSVLVLESQYQTIVPTEQQNALFQQNNEVQTKTVLANYLAYDDGSAESALSTYNGNGVRAKIAVKYQINQGDSLQTIRIMFPHIGSSFSSKLFNLLIYVGSLKAEPDYKLSNLNPTPGNHFQPFTEYIIKDYLPEGIYLPEGEFYIAWEHPQGSRNNFIPFGLDKNYPSANQFIYYDIGGGWEKLSDTNPETVGALMIRPTLGQKRLLTSTPPPTLIENVSIFPNPVKDILHITAPSETGHFDRFDLYNVTGQCIKSAQFDGNTIDFQGFSSGIYFLQLFKKNQYIGSFKVIKR